MERTSLPHYIQTKNWAGPPLKTPKTFLYLTHAHDPLMPQTCDCSGPPACLINAPMAGKELTPDRVHGADKTIGNKPNTATAAMAIDQQETVPGEGSHSKM